MKLTSRVSILFTFTLFSASLTHSLAFAKVADFIRSDYASGEVTQLCQASLDKADHRFAAIAALPADHRTPENSLLAFETAVADVTDETTPLTFMGYVSQKEDIAKEGSACEEKVNQYFVGIFSRIDLYQSVKGAKPRSAQEERLLSETVKAFEKNGLKLSPEKLNQVKELKQKLAGLEAQFSANYNGDQSTVIFTSADLDGVPESFLKGLKKTPDQKAYIVTTKGPDYTEVMENVSNPVTRRKMALAYNNIAADKNVKLLEDAILVREQIARAMGFKTWADYRIDGRMAKDSQTVLSFLNGLKGQLAERNRQDLNKLLQFKKEADPNATKVDSWDIAYLTYQLKKRDYSLDDEKIREYFPKDVVVAGLFKVYSQLLGVQFREIKNAKVWAPGVKLYAIIDPAVKSEVGFFYMDFIPRPGKYPHAAAFPLIAGRRVGGHYSIPISAIVANLSPPVGDKPSLLTHSEVETIFHEFGHIMHQTLTRAPYASLAGSSVAQDFVEAPSQMLENWVWSPEIIDALSGHYQDPTHKLPKELLNQMIAARNFNQGYYYTRQLMLALLDMSYHTADGAVDTTAVQNRLYKDILGIDPIEGGHFQAGFGHLMGGYDAGYYGYLWSEVYAQDMFTVFQAKGLLSAEVGAKYRQVILENGNMKDALDLLREFLGREPNSDAFLRKLGLKAQSASARF